MYPVHPMQAGGSVANGERGCSRRTGFICGPPAWLSCNSLLSKCSQPRSLLENQVLWTMKCTVSHVR